MLLSKPERPKLVAVIPAYNEAGHVGKVVKASKAFVDEVLVVDDGSTDGTCLEASAAGARVFRHWVNRGVGGATATGLRAALQSGADVIVTLDADGQHLPEEIPRVVAPVLNGTADVVIGCRLLNHKGMPLLRVVANRIADACTWLLFGVYLSDTQSGFRAYSRTAAQSIDIRTSGMEVCSEIIVLAVRSGLRVAQVPITPVYTDYSLSKGQSFYNGIRTLAKLMLRRIL